MQRTIFVINLGVGILLAAVGVIGALLASSISQCAQIHSEEIDFAFAVIRTGCLQDGDLAALIAAQLASFLAVGHGLRTVLIELREAITNR